MLISEAFERYRLDVIVFKNQSAKTEENHLVCMRSLVRYFGDIEIESLRFGMIRDWKIHLDKHCSPATVRNYIIKLRVVMFHIRGLGYTVIDPSTIPVPKRPDIAPQYLTPIEVAMCIQATKRIKNKAILSMLYGSMLRISELCNLDRGNIRDKRFSVVGKGGKSRLCFVDERTSVLLDLYLSARDDNNPAMFLSDGGHRITPGAIQETFKTIRKQTGLDVHPHTLRHSGATDLMQNGVHIYSLMRLLGHSNLQSTQVYLHTTDPLLEQEFARCRTT